MGLFSKRANEKRLIKTLINSNITDLLFGNFTTTNNNPNTCDLVLKIPFNMANYFGKMPEEEAIAIVQKEGNLILNTATALSLYLSNPQHIKNMYEVYKEIVNNCNDISEKEKKEEIEKYKKYHDKLKRAIKSLINNTNTIMENLNTCENIHNNFIKAHTKNETKTEQKEEVYNLRGDD